MNGAIAGLASGAGLSLNQGAAAPTVPKAASMAATKKAAQDFEAFFASQMLEQMFAGVKTDSLFGGGHGEEMFRSLLLDAYGKQIAARDGLGIVGTITRSIAGGKGILA